MNTFKHKFSQTFSSDLKTLTSVFCKAGNMFGGKWAVGRTSAISRSLDIVVVSLVLQKGLLDLSFAFLLVDLVSFECLSKYLAKGFTKMHHLIQFDIKGSPI